MLAKLPNFQTKTNYTVTLQADMFENLLTSLNVKEVNILAHDLGLTVALELLARQVNVKKLHKKYEAANELKLHIIVLTYIIISKLTQIRREKAKQAKARRSGYNQHLLNQRRYKSSTQVLLQLTIDD